MNGFKMLADSYRMLLEAGQLTEEQVKRDIEIYEFLATCNQNDFCTIFNSGAFNDIVKGYLRKALNNSEVDSKKSAEILEELRWLLDTLEPNQVI